MANGNGDTWFTKWLRNGRLSGLTFGVVLLAWLGLTVAKLPTDGLTPILYLAAGTFVGNLAIKKDQEDKAVKKELEELKEKVENESP